MIPIELPANDLACIEDINLAVADRGDLNLAVSVLLVDDRGDGVCGVGPLPDR